MIPEYTIGFIKDPTIRGDDSRELVIQGDTEKYYLPGDTKCMILLYSCKTEDQMKHIRVITANIAINIKLVCDEIKKQFKTIEIIINENIRKVVEERLGAIGSLKETLKEIYKKYPRDTNLFVRPTKIIKATRLNRKINKIIYYHIRSNC